MYERILALLLTSYAGMRKDGLAQLARSLALQATTEEEANNLVNTLTKEKVEGFIKDYRSDVDKEVTEGNKTFEANLRKKYDLKEKSPSDPPSSDPPPADSVAAIVKEAVAEAVKPFQEKLAGYEQGDLAKTRLENLTEKLNTCKDETFKAKALKDFGRMSFENDEAFEEYMRDTEADVASANQNLADSKLGGHGKPLFSGKTEEGISSNVADYLAEQSGENTKFSGKEV